MKQNITLSLDRQLLKKARAFAAKRGTSVSLMLAQELQRLVTDDVAYEQAKVRALAVLDAPFRLGGERPADRESLHDRQSLR